MTNLNRTQSIEMWELISKGGLRDVEGQCPISELGDMSPLEFVEQVAAKMLAANACEAKSRWAQIVMAAGLGGKMPDTETVIRRAVSVLCDKARNPSSVLQLLRDCDIQVRCCWLLCCQC